MAAKSTQHTRMRARLTALAFAFCTTLIALPSVAVTIPDVPLQSGQAYPPANVRFTRARWPGTSCPARAARAKCPP